MADVNELDENTRGNKTNKDNAGDAHEGNVPLPGQTEDNPDSDQNEVHADTVEDSGAAKTYRIKLSEGRTSSAAKEECCCNEVVPFALDEDFDYDNVVLTPKFTIHEMKALPK